MEHHYSHHLPGCYPQKLPLILTFEMLERHFFKRSNLIGRVDFGSVLQQTADDIRVSSARSPSETRHVVLLQCWIWLLLYSFSISFCKCRLAEISAHESRWNMRNEPHWTNLTLDIRVGITLEENFCNISPPLVAGPHQGSPSCLLDKK